MLAFRTVVAYVPPGATALGLGIASGVFAPAPGRPGFDLAFCAERPGHVTTDLGLGLGLRVDHGPARLAHADLVLVLPGAGFREPTPAPVLRALRRAHDRGVTIAAHCTGVFVLAAAGLLDGRQATTHWQFADELRTRHPTVDVRAGDLYVDAGQVVTGAGAAAGLDMCLHLVRRAHGAAAANAIARGLVTPPHRDGGQSQYVDRSVPELADGGRLSDVIAWARGNLDGRVTVNELAARALMSPRSFARHFKATTGMPPHAWLRAQRLDHAEALLEATDLSIEEIASRTGYASGAALREQFQGRRGLPPRDYRRAFARTGDTAGD